MAQSADTPSPPNLSESRLRDEQIELLFAHGPSLVLGNILGIVSVTLMVWHAFELHALLAWLAAIIVMTVARTGLIVAHNGRYRERLNTKTWGLLFITAATLSGLCWGSLSYLTANPDPLTLAAIGMILAGLTGAAAPSLGTLYITYVLYAATTLIPYAIRCFTHEHPLAFGMGFIAVSYLVCTLIISGVNNRFNKESIRLRFQNLDLLRQLQVQTQAAEEARFSAESANSGKTRFLAAASHDMRQPLQSVSLLADALQEEPLSPNAQRLLSSMRDATNSMGELMDELMDYSRIDTGTQEAEFRSFNLASLLVRIEAEFAPLAAQRGLRLHVRSRPLRVFSDRRMVERILRNLVSNAVKYTNSGGVIVACRLRGKNVRLEVWDSGIGIPMDKRDEIFREFYQLDNPERDRRKGLGLGLAIVDGLARLLGQRLQLRSVQGKGSVFAVELPRDITDQAATAIRPPTLAPLPQKLNRVLIIDNEVVIQQAMSALLSAWGCKPIAAESLEDALAQLDAPPDVILADYRLQEGRTGIEAIEGVRNHFKLTIPAAVITGDTDPHRLAEARASGFPLLQKPTPSSHLREVLARLLQTAATQQG